MKLQYRALEGTNTQARRIAYLSAIISILNREGLSEKALMARLEDWSRKHDADLQSYHARTGAVTSSLASARYLHLAIKSGLITPIAGVYRTTRIGLVLLALIKRFKVDRNPFRLSIAEKLFYTNHLLKVDADILITLMDHVLSQTSITLSELQRAFQVDFIRRLEKKQKPAVSQGEGLRQHLLERRAKVSTGWKNPERYAEHLVPPRLNWLLDLDFLEISAFLQHRYVLSAAGKQFLAALPHFNVDEEVLFHDVTSQWLDSEYWKIAALTLCKDKEPFSEWEELEEEKRLLSLQDLLPDTFECFRYTSIPKVSLIQVFLCLSIWLLLEDGIIASPATLGEWFSTPKVIRGYRYEVRFSPRENESYLLATLV